MFRAAVVALLFVGALGFDCSATFQGHTYNLSPLIATNGSYTWGVKAINVAGNNIITLAEDTVTYRYELQVCGAVKSAFSTCKPGSAINRIDPQGNCTSLGNADVAFFSPNPYNDGVYLSYWAGDDIDHIQKYSSRIYFICDQGHQVTPPVFEHEKSFYQNHFSIQTSLAC
eukprot:m.225025 g.225025  ORF g.225025 m.225025 type:complete len:171 (-) comp11195_c0_seq1:38-550(-)